MFSPLSKISAVCIVAIALGLMVNGARAESYGSDAPNAGVSQAKAKAPGQGYSQAVRRPSAD